MKALTVFFFVLGCGLLYGEWTQSAPPVTEPPIVKPIEAVPVPPTPNPGQDLGSPEVVLFQGPVADLAPASPEPPNFDQYVFRVRQKTSDTTSRLGSAVSIGNGRLATASHVFVRGRDPEVFVNGEWIPGKLTVFPGYDFAYVDTANKDLPSVRSRPPVAGEHVTTYGTTTRFPWSGTAVGPQSPNPRKWDILNEIQSLGYSENGDSGGGVFGDDGSLVMIHNGNAYDGKQRFTFATPFPQSKPEVSNAPAHQDGSQVYLLTAPSWCPPCRTVDTNLLPKLREDGIEPMVVDYGSGNAPSQAAMDLMISIQYHPAQVILPVFLKVKDGKVISSRTGILSVQQYIDFSK